MRSLINKIKINFYILLLIIDDFFEDLLNKLNGREVELEYDPFQEQIVQQYQNTKLRRGIQKIVRAIYDKNGRLKDSFKTKEADLISVASGYKKSLIEKLEEAKLQQKLLEDPTDESGTDDKMVMHNVKNAPKYLLNQKKRELWKELTKALITDEIDEVKRLRKEIDAINNEINRI